MLKPKISVAIATFNEEKNIRECLESVKKIADEIIIVDGKSTDKTVEIAKTFGAKVTTAENYPIFHINKQKSFDLATGDWVLYLDADERVTPKLAEEITKMTSMKDEEIKIYQEKIPNKGIFLRHQGLLEKRDGPIGTEAGEFVAFFFPRLNYFLGKYLKYGGVYPDGVIRLFKRGQAYLPCKDVHEQMVVNGKVGWLQNDLLHIDSPTFQRYLDRNSRYINLIVDSLQQDKTPKNIQQFLNYIFFKPIYWFLLTTFRHKGLLDGYQGIIFSLFSALRFPRAYWRYLWTV
jgi:glycosyltransferase involved in cell wall biosynthesis